MPKPTSMSQLGARTKLDGGRSSKRKENIVLYWLGIFLLITFIVIYHYEIVRPAYANYTTEETFSHIANIHDHHVYVEALLNFDVDANAAGYNFDNVNGISRFYFIINNFLGFDNLATLSLLINCTALIIAAAIHANICHVYALRGSAYTFFLNLPLIYFCQLIGKDMLYVSVLYAMLFFILRKSWINLAAIATLASIAIRSQAIIILAFVLITIFWKVSYRRRFGVLYTLSAVAGAYAFVGGEVIGIDADLGSGISGIVFELNKVLGVGNLILNPVRLLQYIGEFILATSTQLSASINYFNLFLAPFFIYFVLHIKWLCQGMLASDSPATQFVHILILVLLITPIVNLRYFIAILPFVVIAMQMFSLRVDVAVNPKESTMTCSSRNG